MARQRILIIGGGMAGASLGSELAIDNDVVLLEAESSLGVHSTGRSAALFLETYGPPPVQELTRQSEAEFARLSGAPGGHELLMPRGGMVTAWDELTASVLARTVATRPFMTMLSRDQARAMCPALLVDGMVACAYDRSARDIDVSALFQHYVATLRRREGQIVTGARVTTATRLRTTWQVETADGLVWQADVLVNAAGAWGDQVAEASAGRGHGLSPRRRTVAICRPAGPISADWPVVADVAETWYFKPEGASVLLSPSDETQVVAGDVKPDPLDIALVLERVNAVTSLGLRSVQTSWAGLRTFAPDRVPLVGPHPDEATLFTFLGQGGYGIQMAPALAQAGAELFRTGTLSDAALAAALDPARQRTVVAHSFDPMTRDTVEDPS